MVELDADAGRAAVDDQVDAAVEIGAHMLRRSSARRGRTDWPTARPPACRRPSAGRARSGGPARAPRSSRARRWRVPTPGSRPPSAAPGSAAPARTRRRAASRRRKSARARSAALRVRHMRDQRIEARAALGGIEPRDRRAVGGVGAEAVDRLGRERDQPALAQHARGRRDRVAVGVSRRVATSTGMNGFRIGFAPLHWAEATHPSRDESMTYRAPVADIAFTLKHSAGLEARARRGALRRSDRGRGRRRAGGGRQVRLRR